MATQDTEFLNLACNTLVYMPYKGQLRQVKYLGFDYHQSSMCGGSAYSSFFFNLGKGEIVSFRSGELSPLYMSVEDFKTRSNRVEITRLPDEVFNSMYMRNTKMTKRGSSFGAYRLSIDFEPTFYAITCDKGCVIRHLRIRDNEYQCCLTYNGEEFRPNLDKYYKTAEECRLMQVPKVVAFEE